MDYDMIEVFGAVVTAEKFFWNININQFIDQFYAFLAKNNQNLKIR